MTISTAMVIGAGQMGGGIAQVMAQAGRKVYLNDVDQTFIDKRIAFIDSLLTKDISKGRITEDDKAKALANLIPTTSLDPAAECDLVVEAIVENMDVKAKVFSQLDELCPPATILASNTSSLPITEIAAHTKRPDKVIGMHFMNPVPVMKLVEMIRGIATSDETTATVRQEAIDLGKTPVEVRDVPGFISNRLLMIMINEAVYSLYEGVATVEDIDTVMKLGMNHPMGPLTLADFIGLDTCLAIMEIMHEGYGDSKYRPCPLLRQYVKAGWLGKKSGRGFYTYA
ncbi:MAG: 3-hydroxybutyryl-CoA dehydrogenase [Propionibacteriaceae bacterium]|jgi:3-hydroxybutyryl-CoA dehydrogenase|nr:3-hydroxybutyryl-CoA dehydrogenase [Propionibacteriaceae bacterium]